MTTLSFINETAGLITALLLIAAGFYFSAKTGFFQFLHFGKLTKKTVGNLFSGKNTSEGLSSLQAFITSLAGTIGVGNIVGVSAAIAIGGAGSLFWMTLTAFLSMVIKYAEIWLSVSEGQDLHLPKNKNYSFAPMVYIEKGTKSPAAAVVFAALGLISAILMGSMTQINAVSLSCCPTFHISPVWIGILLTVFFLPVVLKGIRGVLKVTEIILPLFGLCYLAAGLIIIFLNLSRLPAIFQEIFRSAFSLEASAGGLLGCGIVAAFKQGMIKGVFSNEAGLGSAGLAHGSCRERRPEEQGLWGAVEVFLDTVVISGITGLVILCAGAENDGYNGLFAAFQKVFGSAGGLFISICILFFAVASVLSWSYYGESCAVFLFGESPKSQTVFRLIFCLSVFFGAVFSAEKLWLLAELINSGMILINMAGIIGLRKKIKGNPLKKPI